MTVINNELIELNETLLKKSGTLSIILANSIIDSIKDLSEDDLKDVLVDIDSDLMLSRIFTTAFSRKEMEICLAIKEILEERHSKYSD